ncbi:MAG: XrtA/PEP-CTERM system histidine kinase PrsK [Pseudomonadota bacterium]
MSLVAISYLVAALSYLALFAFLSVGRRFDWPFNFLLVFAGLMTVWAAGLTWATNSDITFASLLLIESLHAIGGLLFLGQLIGRGNRTAWQRGFVLLPWVVLAAGGLVYWWVRSGGGVGFDALYYFVVFVSLAGLLATEQIYRNVGLLKHSVAMLVAVSFGTLFVFDLYTYSNALLAAGISEELWAARGFINALAVPVLVLAIKREPEWRGNLFVSRQVVFYTTSLVGVGVYLVLVAFGSVLIQRLGGNWGAVLRIVFLAASLVLLLLILFSQQVRRRVKVFLATHFYANRYDYREEWLRLIGRLAQDSERAPMPELCLNALVDIIESDGGVLWLRDPDDRSRWYAGAAFGERTGSNELSAEHALPDFLERTGWIVDGAEALANPTHYQNVFDADNEEVVTTGRIFVPIVFDGELSGIACLNRPAGLPTMNFEDHDLLRTVGQQLAVFLQRDRNREQLAEAREFEVFNRFTAFIMHDLKNLIAQQSLVVANAEKHKSNPEFIDDAIGTIANSVTRMNGLLEQLQGGERQGVARPVSVGDVARQAVEGAAGRVPEPTIEVQSDGHVLADADRLTAVLGHLIRNAQEASQSDGRVSLTVRAQDGVVRLEIEDDGTGMTQDFVRERLFRPFDSTKGAKGMGIGMYQARDYVRFVGGALEVDSTPGVGTLITLSFPRET